MIKRNFTPFPILTNERLTLRQLSVDDKQNIFALRSDKAINQYLNRQPSKTMEDAADFINRINDSIAKDESIYWAITLKEANTFVGTICLYDFSEENNSCEIGYELLTSFQRQGIMKAAATLVIEYAFAVLQCKNIIAYTHHCNQRSTKLLQELDFIPSSMADKENSEVDIYTLTNLY